MSDFKVGDAYALDFPDHAFDIVHSHAVLHHLADTVSALREWRRVTKPGGIVACRTSDFDSGTLFPEIEALSGFKEVYMKMIRSHGGEPNGGRHLIAWACKSGIEIRIVRALRFLY